MDTSAISQDATAANQYPLRRQKFRFFRFLWVVPAILLLLVIAATFIALQFRSNGGGLDQNKKFELTESSPDDQQGDFSSYGQPTFVFSKKIGIKESDLPNYFHLSPSVSGAWHLEKNGQVVYFSADSKQSDGFPNVFSFNNVYTITIDKGFHSTDNQSLEQNKTISFRTKQNPQFPFDLNTKLLVTSPNTSVDVTIETFSASKPILTSPAPLTAEITQTSEDQLLNYFSYKENKNPLYEYSGNDQSTTKQISVPIQIANYSNGFIAHFPVDAFPHEGLYYVKLKNNTGSVDLFVNAANHINQVFADSKTTGVWVTDKNNGKSLSDVTTKLYSVKGSPKLLEQSTTDVNGLVKSNQQNKDVDFVLTKKGSDMAITFSKKFDPFGRISSPDQPYYQVYSYSDRPVYRPGDLVHYKAVIRKKVEGGYAVAQGNFYLRLDLGDIKNNPDRFNQSVTVDQNGTVTNDFTLPKMVLETSPTIVLSMKKQDGTFSQLDSLPLNVQAYRKPDMDISATTNEKEYISSDSAHMRVIGKTNFGQPLSNVDFTYRVLISNTSEVKDRTLEAIDVEAGPYYGQGDELTSGTGKFDSKGVADLTFSTALPEKYESSQIATLEITPNIGASPSIGKIAKLIHRGEFAIFEDSLAGDTENGITGNIEVLTHDIPRKPVANKQVTISLFKTVNYTEKVFVTSQTVTTSDTGRVGFNFSDVTAFANYEVVAKANDERGNTVTARAQVYINTILTQTPNQNFISATTQKNSYNPTDTAQVTVTGNFPITDVVAAVTDDGGGNTQLVALKQYTVNGSSSVISIPLKNEYGSGLGVDIFAVSKGTVLSAHATVLIDKKSQKLTTTLSFDKNTYKPGETVSATIKTVDQDGKPVSADNSLAVIDNSILQIGKLNGDIFSTFYSGSFYAYVTHYDSTTGIARNEGGGGGGCFLEGTKIQMSDGSLKNIEDVKIGDKILTRESDISSHLVEDTVTNTYQHAVTDYLTINDRLQVTWIHRIFLNNSWQEAGDARVGDTLLDENGNQVKITSIVPHQGLFNVYNLTTKKYHTFFADGIYVHNQKGEGPRQNFADTAYWNAHIQTDAQGLAHVSFKLPDNLTTFTAQTFSNTKDAQFGQTIGSFVSQKDFNIVPVVANFYYQDDKPVVTALIQNSSKTAVSADVSLQIKELGFSKSETVQIASNDFQQISFPLSVDKKVNTVTFEITAKDGSGATLDSVSLKKPILPKGSIYSSWRSFEGNHAVNLQATLPDLDFNNAYVEVVPNIASKLFNQYTYLSYGPSIEAGKDVYAYSSILAQTRDGTVSPTSYGYAKLKNDFRDAVENLLDTRMGNSWIYPSGGQSFLSVNLWIDQGLTQANSLHMLSEITNIDQIVANDKKDLNDVTTGPDPDEDYLIRQWVRKESISDPLYKNSPVDLAIQVLNGNMEALPKLRQAVIPSATDRYVWTGSSTNQMVFPVLAMIEKGTDEDADKAIKGLSFLQLNNSYDPLFVMAGIQYAQRKKLFVDEPQITVKVNDQEVYSNKKTDPFYQSFSQSFTFENTKDGKLNIQIAKTGAMPVYTDLVQTDYSDTDHISTGTDDSFFAKLQRFLGTKNSETFGKKMDLTLQRHYWDLQTGQGVSQIPEGHDGIVFFSVPFNFGDTFSSTSSYQSHQKYSFILEDALSPGFMYLNQSYSYFSGNSPQYQNALDVRFPSQTQYGIGYTSASNYSDEAVFFGEYPAQVPPVLPYVVYNVSGGTYYQPKTSFVLSTLGIISEER